MTESVQKQLLIGWATVDITPARPVQLMGQYYERISQGVRDPLCATALALAAGSEQAVIVSCDSCEITEPLLERTRQLLRSRVTLLDPEKLVLAATHSHTAPVLEDGWYPAPPPGVMTGTECTESLAERLAELVAAAWSNCQPGAVSWALGRASVGHNRRVLYDDGTAQMYGRTDRPDFAGAEGGDEDGVELLFTWDRDGALTGVVVDVACPSQVLERLSVLSGDYWSEVRNQLRARLGPGLSVLPLCSAAGDQSPRDLVRRGRGEADFHNESGVVELGRRLSATVECALPEATATRRERVPFKHLSTLLDLPARKVTDAEADAVRLEQAALIQKELASGEHDLGQMREYTDLLARHEKQGDCPVYSIELHVMRLGDIALVTNPFELFLDYGLRIKARSRAVQTLLVQLACGIGGYLPTAKAVAGGGYSARVMDGQVGPDGGQVLVERSVEAINALFQDGAL